MDPDALYGLALDRFVAERGAIVKALRGDGRRDEAKDVAALRKPSVAAWVVNQLVRTQRQATKELYAAGDALRAAQEDLLAGTGDGRTLRAANERERAAVDALADAARGLLSGEGQEPSGAVIERVADTLHAAALDEDARAQVRDGRLERELRHAGLGLGESVFAPVPPARATPAAPSRPEPKPQASAKPDAAAPRAAAERAAAQRAEQERKTARAAEAKARRDAERAARALEAAEEQREQAAEALREADELLGVARAAAHQAAVAHERARAELDD